MGKVNLSSGGVRANVRAGEEIPADTLFKYSAVVNEVEVCGAGEEADGLCLVAVAEGEILNMEGTCYARTTTGVFDEVTINDTFTCGSEFMSDANGQIVSYSSGGDNRPLGKFLSTGSTGQTGKILFYSK